MANLNRFKFTFGKKSLTLTSEHDNLFMEEIAKVATEKYQAIKEQMPSADDETIALLLAVNCLSTQLSREIEFDDKEQELEERRHKLVTCKQERLSERTALTGLLPDFSTGIGFCGWPVLQGAWRAIPFIAPLCKSTGRSGDFLFPIGSTLSVR